MGQSVDHAEHANVPTPAADGPQHWSVDELAEMSSMQGTGRVLTLRPGAGGEGLERCLRHAGYRVGRIGITREPTHLPLAAASFLPDVIYVALCAPLGACLDALEVLSVDPRTADLPLVAVIEGEIEPSVIEEAYARAGCDFLRLGTHVELLARTDLLVRLSARGSGVRPSFRAPPEVANDPTGTRLDLRDGATGVYSATYFRHRLQQEVARAHRYQRPLALLAIRCPAAASDEAAARLASILESACRNVDLVVRLEPDVFAVLLPETTCERSAVVTARIREECEAAGLGARFGTAGLGGAADDAAYSAASLVRMACMHVDGPHGPM